PVKQVLISSVFGTNSRHSRITAGVQARRSSMLCCAVAGAMPADSPRTRPAAATCTIRTVPMLLMIVTPLVGSHAAESHAAENRDSGGSGVKNSRRPCDQQCGYVAP